MADKVFIMNFKNEKVGEIEKRKDFFIQTYMGKTENFTTLPPIMQGIAPAPTQFPAAIEVLNYYKINKLDVWEYLHKSNGFKNSRDIWFLSEPIGGGMDIFSCRYAKI